MRGLFLTIVLMGIFQIVVNQAALSQSLEPVSYQDGNHKLKGYITSNGVKQLSGEQLEKDLSNAKKLPGVLILPAWKGVDNEARTAALELEKEGYIAFVADIYGEENTPQDNAAAA